MPNSRTTRMFITAAIAVTVWSGGNGDLTVPVLAQDAPPTAQDAANENLPLRQDSVAVRFQRFEKTLLELADQMRQADPERANLLFRGISRSKEKQVREQLVYIGKLLEERRLGDALDRQEDVIEVMAGLLQLLQSEDRRSEIEKEKERLRDLIKDVDNLIGREKDLRADTQRGGELDRATDRQEQIAESTKELLEKIARQDAEKAGSSGSSSSGQPMDGESSPSDSSDEEQKPSDAEQSDKKPGDPDSEDKQPGKEPGEESPMPEEDGKPPMPSDGAAGKPSESGKSEEKSGESPPSQSESESSPSESKPSQGGQSPPQESQPQQGPSPEGEQQSGESSDSPSENQESQNTPGREQLEQAKREMERVIEELKKDARDEASGKQDEAVAKLQEAKARLEEILRQLREEEKELMLTALEARLREMLGKQLIIYQGTVGLGQVPEDERTGRHTSRAIQLSRDEELLAVDIEKALLLLREEGSSVAFPEALGQLQEDVRTVASRLERTEVGELTQAIEQDIIEALEEMVDALQKELEKMKKDQQQQQQQQGQPQDQALVDTLGELKMLRSLQLRVNRATRRLGRLVEGEQAVDGDVVKQLNQLSRRQARIRQATYNLSAGRNR